MVINIFPLNRYTNDPCNASHGFQNDFENPSKNQSQSLHAEVTNTVSTFGHLYVSLTSSFIVFKWFTNGHHIDFQGSYIDLKIVKTSHFGAKVTNINIWTPLSFSDNSFYFFLRDLQMAYTMVFWRCQRILKPLQKLKLVISVLR